MLSLLHQIKANDQMKDLINKINIAINNITNGYSSEYINYTDNADNCWTIRISNHKANPLRVTDNFISLVIDAPLNLNTEDGWSINEKSFREISNQFYLNQFGEFTENFNNLEDCLNYVIY